MRYGVAILLIVATFCLGGCSEGTKPSVPQKNNVQEIGPITGPRSDGYYLETVGEVLYLMRFFPGQRIVLINGTKTVADSLPPMLFPEAKGDPGMGWYNVNYRTHGDSIFFTTSAERGDLDYRGVQLNDTVVRFERYSHINGDRRIKTYDLIVD